MANQNTLAFYWPPRLGLGAVVFVSGIFGSKMANLKMVGTTVTTHFVMAILALSGYIWMWGFDTPVGPLWTWEFVGGAKWYGWSLLIWRFIVPSAHHYCTVRWKLPVVVPFAVIFVISYLMRHMTGYLFPASECFLEAPIPMNFGTDLKLGRVSPMDLMTSTKCNIVLPRGAHVNDSIRHLFGNSFMRYNWMNLWYYAPFYALGLVFPPSVWTHHLKDHRLVIASLVLFVVWYGLHVASEQLRSWNTMSCFIGDKCPSGVQYPAAVVYDPVSLSGFVFDLFEFVQRALLSLAAVWMSGFFVMKVEAWSPWLANAFAESGKRSGYSYLLHVIVLQFAFLTGVWQYTEYIPEIVRFPLIWIAAVLMQLALASRFTEMCFTYLLQPGLAMKNLRAMSVNFRRKKAG